MMMIFKLKPFLVKNKIYKLLNKNNSNHKQKRNKANFINKNLLKIR